MIWNDNELSSDGRLTLLGRRSEQDPLSFFWPGSGIALQAGIRELYARIEAGWSEYSPWMSVLVDDAPVARFPLRRGTHDYALLSGMDGETPHRVKLIRDTQPMEDDTALTVRLKSLELDGVLLEQPARPRIEFIGDSLTSGEGLTGPRGAAEWKTVWMSCAPNYASKVCSLLGADGEWVSQSGWGIVTDWNQDRRHVIPAIYDQVCGVVAAGRTGYDFSTHPVEAVVVNLGTNDMSALNALPASDQDGRRTEIVTGVRSFLRQIRAVRPGIPILWVCGMCGDGLNAMLSDAVKAVSAETSDWQIRFYPLPACEADETGSLNHPGEPSHRRCASLIAGQLRELLKNEKVSTTDADR